MVSERHVLGLNTITSAIKKELELFLKLFVILYADDTIIMAESASDLQY